MALAVVNPTMHDKATGLKATGLKANWVEVFSKHPAFAGDTILVELVADQLVLHEVQPDLLAMMSDALTMVESLVKPLLGDKPAVPWSYFSFVLQGLIRGTQLRPRLLLRNISN